MSTFPLLLFSSVFKLLLFDVVENPYQRFFFILSISFFNLLISSVVLLRVHFILQSISLLNVSTIICTVCLSTLLHVFDFAFSRTIKSVRTSQPDLFSLSHQNTQNAPKYILNYNIMHLSEVEVLSLNSYWSPQLQ